MIRTRRDFGDMRNREAGIGPSPIAGFDVCRRCARHVKSAEPSCPFCGASHTPNRSGRPAVRGRVSRAHWLAFGSTLALLSCNDSPRRSDAGDLDVSASDSEVADAAALDVDLSDDALTDADSTLLDGSAPAEIDFVQR